MTEELRLSSYVDLFASFLLVAVSLEAQKRNGVANRDSQIIPRYDRIYNKVLIALAETKGVV